MLTREVKERFREFELCRARVAGLTGMEVEDVKAGRIAAQWTILPAGDTRDTLVLQETRTALALMKCARRQMNAWRFTAPPGGPVEVAFEYDFSRRAVEPSAPAGSQARPVHGNRIDEKVP